MEKELEKKYKVLKEKIASYVSGGAVVAFSGGVDSALVLKLTRMSVGGKSPIYAVTVQTKLHPAGDTKEAKRMAEEIGALHQVLQIDELAETGIETNPVNRCYLCKKSIFGKIKEFAKERGADCILEGTNADDLKQYRPGIRALKELQIISPLAECGLTKAEIRELAQYLDIPAANRPSAPCLATRLPYGTKISYELLAKIDKGERCLREIGCYNVRLRVHEMTEIVNKEMAGDFNLLKQENENRKMQKEKRWLARMEVDAVDMPKLLENREELVKKIKEFGFHRVTLDMEGFRSGSMDG